MLRQRQPRVRNGAYLAWLARAPCVGCMAKGRGPVFGVHCAHLRMGSAERGKRPAGMSEKPSDEFATPLCPDCHMYGRDAQHVIGEQAFWRQILIDPFTLCADLKAAYEAGASAFGIIARHAGQAQRQRREIASE